MHEGRWMAARRPLSALTSAVSVFLERSGSIEVGWTCSPDNHFQGKEGSGTHRFRDAKLTKTCEQGRVAAQRGKQLVFAPVLVEIPPSPVLGALGSAAFEALSVFVALKTSFLLMRRLENCFQVTRSFPPRAQTCSRAARVRPTEWVAVNCQPSY